VQLVLLDIAEAERRRLLPPPRGQLDVAAFKQCDRQGAGIGKGVQPEQAGFQPPRHVAAFDPRVVGGVLPTHERGRRTGESVTAVHIDDLIVHIWLLRAEFTTRRF
jgi:hypothetical protein